LAFLLPHLPMVASGALHASLSYTRGTGGTIE
jgi:hypothetical protein